MRWYPHRLNREPGFRADLIARPALSVSEQRGEKDRVDHLVARAPMEKLELDTPPQTTHTSWGNWRAYWADTISRSVPYIPIIGAWEWAVAGMNLTTVVKARVFGLVVGLVLNRPQGKAREYISQITHTYPDSSSVRKTIVDMATGLVLAAMTYPLVAWVAGASLEQAQKTAPFVLVLATLGGRVLGKINDFGRRMAHVKPVYEKMPEDNKTVRPEFES